MKLSCRSKRALALSCLITVSHSAFAVEFYTDLIDAKDKENLDMSAFSEEGYIMPGMYVMNISLNGRIVTQADLRFYNRKINKKVAGDRGNSACITKELIPFLGLKDRIEDKLVYEDNNKCAKLDDLPGFTAKGELSDSTLYLMLPKKYLKSEGNKASNWENGIPGVLVDYNLALSSTQYYQRDNIQAARGYGTFGGNAGPWRLRADFHSAYENDYSEKLSFDWDRIYMYRAISQINGELEIGEDYLNSDIFSAFRFAGVSLQSDERMIPASLRGYAPEVRGIARTNALVTVRQSGRVVYETIVAAGPFTINELSSAVSGVLQVEVKEQDGEITFFEVDTATVPYLTRPGQFRFKTVTGRPLSR
ncbi:fimbria/pilus outer membrane usher protein, partial [Pantoea endophytica]